MPAEFLELPFEAFISTRLGSNQYNSKVYKKALGSFFMNILGIDEEPLITGLRDVSGYYQRYAVNLTFYLVNQNCDIDNMCKLTIDVLKFYIGQDDMSIHVLNAKKILRKNNPGVRIKVKRIN